MDESYSHCYLDVTVRLCAHQHYSVYIQEYITNITVYTEEQLSYIFVISLFYGTESWYCGFGFLCCREVPTACGWCVRSDRERETNHQQRGHYSDLTTQHFPAHKNQPPRHESDITCCHY